MMINHLGREGQKKVEQPCGYGRANRVELEAHRGDDPKVPAAVAKAPEQVAIVSVTGRDQLAIRSDDRSRSEVVAAKADFAMQPAKPPPSVKPAMPVMETIGPVQASPNA
jgi:hypothetical protein